MTVRGIAWLSAMLAACAGTLQAEVTLVEDGKARAVVVLADQPAAVATYAAEELRAHVQKVSGCRLPIVTERKLDPNETRALVLVGDSRLAAGAGHETAKMEPESTLVRTEGNRLVLIGGDRGRFDLKRHPGNANGTLYAVYDFLEGELGVRWLWPGDVGTVIPAKKTIRVGRLDRRFTPPLIQRKIRFGLRDDAGYVAKLGRTKEMAGRIALEFAVWARRRRLGQRAMFRFGHAYNYWLKDYGKEHPEWFAMMPDGRRVTPERPYPSLERAKLCVTNPDLLDFIAKKGMEYLEKHPQDLSFSACPNDSRGYCMCPKCKALDHPEGVKDEVTYPEKGQFLYPSLSDRYVWFWNELAKRLGDRYPGRYIGAYAYSNYRFPPLREKLSNRVIIAYVGFNYLSADYTSQSRKDWAGWAATGCKLYLRPNLLLVGHGFPLNYVTEFGKDLKECFRTGMLGADFDSMTHHYASQAPVFHVLTALLWDPRQDVARLMSDFLASAYGPAAPVMRRYWDRLEAVTRHIAATTSANARRAGHDQRLAFHELAPTVYTDGLLGELRGLLAEARTAAAGRPDVLARLGVAAVGLEYAEVQRDTLTTVAEHNRTGKGLDGVLEALHRKNAFFARHVSDWTIGLCHVYWREARSTTHAMMYGTLLSDANIHPRMLAKLVDWRFTTDPNDSGERKGYHKPGFDDTGWKPVTAMTFWERQGFDGYDGVGWYRRKLRVPAEWRRHKRIILRFGAVDESFRLYIDGNLVREWLYDGMKDPKLWTKPRPVDITKHVRFGGEHTLAVKVHDSGGAGGLWKSVLVVYE